MSNTTAFPLSPKLYDNDVPQEANRAGFGRGLQRAGKLNDHIVALCADLTESTKMNLFAEAFPERFFEVGVAEQNLVTVAAGLAALDYIPFAASYAAFMPGRCWEQIRTTICLNDRPVKLVGAHAGVSVGPDGATHQMLEDIALMRVLPNMVVIAPCDSIEAEKATLAMARDPRPNYIRLARADSPIITTNESPFEIGRAYVLDAGEDITILSTGTMTYQALMAAAELYKQGIDAEVIHVPTIKPLDSDTILKSVRRTKRAITIEEGQMAGGFGGAIAELLSEHCPVPLKRIGMQDRFGESGQPEELLEYFGLDAKQLVKQAMLLTRR